MKRYLQVKLASFVITILIANLVTLLILQVLPGDPALLVLGMEGSPQAYGRLRSELNLDQPFFRRYLGSLVDFARGRWGTSLRYSIPVRELIREALPLSLCLALLAVGAALALAVPAGMLMAVRPRARLGRIAAFGSQIGMAVPQFWLGLLLIQMFAVQLRILPAGGNSGWRGLILPVLTLALPRAAILSRLVRAGVANALKQDYIRTAWAKGLPARSVFFKHALRSGSLGMLTVAGLQFSQLFAGTIVVEQVFGLPGLGRLLLAGVMQRDLTLVQAVAMLVVLMVLGFNLLFDLGLGFVDPRLRYE